MKRTRAQQPKALALEQPSQDADAGNPNKPQRRAKQPRQPNKGAAKKPGAAAASVASPGPETAPTVPDVCGGVGEDAAGAQATTDWEDLDDAGLSLSGGAWWNWGVDEDKLLGWFPFVEEDFRCLGGRAGDAEVAFDDDIWRIHQIHEIPNYAAK